MRNYNVHYPVNVVDEDDKKDKKEDEKEEGEKKMGLTIPMFCDVCSEELEGELEVSFNDIKIKVTPCQNCITEDKAFYCEKCDTELDVTLDDVGNIVVKPCENCFPEKEEDEEVEEEVEKVFSETVVSPSVPVTKRVEVEEEVWQTDDPFAPKTS